MSLSPLVRPDSSNLMMGHIVLFNSEFQQLREEARRRGRLAYIDCVRHRPASIVGDFPDDLAPLASDLNLLLDANREVVRRARTQVGNEARTQEIERHGKGGGGLERHLLDHRTPRQESIDAQVRCGPCTIG